MVNFKGLPIVKTEHKKFTGTLMHMTNEIAEITDDEITNVLNQNLLPIHFKLGRSFSGWLTSRSIDTHRPNSRRLRQRLSLKTEVPRELVLLFHAVSLTDNYWLKAKGSTITYKDINNITDVLSDTALYGTELDDAIKKDELNNNYLLTPEFTLVGSFEKCWKYINNRWYLIKKGSTDENFSELLASRLGKYFGMDIVEYDLFNDNPSYVMCRNFTKNPDYDFTPMSVFVEDNDDFELSDEILSKLNIDIKSYYDMLFLDGLIFNYDRHTNNYGVLSDVTTGDIVKLAPNFDNNLSLIAYQLKGVDSNIHLTKMIKEFLDEKEYKPPKLEYKDLLNIIREVYLRIPNISYPIDFIVSFIWTRYELLSKTDNMNLF